METRLEKNLKSSKTNQIKTYSASISQRTFQGKNQNNSQCLIVFNSYVDILDTKISDILKDETKLGETFAQAALDIEMSNNERLEKVDEEIAMMYIQVF